MCHGDHDISLLVPLLNVPEGFRDLLQRITSVDDRLERVFKQKGVTAYLADWHGAD
jgi:hypothetical protein